MGDGDCHSIDSIRSRWLSNVVFKTNGEGLGMKRMLIAAALMLAATGAQAQGYGTNPSTHTSSGYSTSRGTVV